MINVRLSIIPGRSSVFALEDGSSIKELFDIAEEKGFDSVISDGNLINGYLKNGYDIIRNGNIYIGTTLKDGDRVMIERSMLTFPKHYSID